MSGRPGGKPPHRQVDGNYLAKPFEVLDHPAYFTGSHRMKAVLEAIQREFNGFNNGRLCVSRDVIARRSGSKNHAANRKALGEAIERGLLVVEKVHPVGSRLAPEYRLTYISTGDHKSPVPATRDYLAWTEERRRRRRQPPQGNFARKDIEQGNLIRGSIIERERKLSGSIVEPQQPRNAGFRGSNIEQHIVYQGAAPDRPACIPEDRWILAARAAAANPAGPDPDELRRRVREHLDGAAPGAQSRLAREAGILKGTFSKFLSAQTPLANDARVRLACAVERVKPHEAQRKARTILEGRVPDAKPQDSLPEKEAASRAPTVVPLQAWSKEERDALRWRTVAYLRRLGRGRGAGNQLAAEAGLSSSEVSSFKLGGKGLRAPKLNSLAAALDRLEGEEGAPFGAEVTRLSPAGAPNPSRGRAAP